MKKWTAEQKKSLWKLSGAALLLAGVLIGLWVLLKPLVQALSTPEGEEALRDWISSLGLRGWLLFLGLQILQIVVAFIPGEPVQLIAGMLYGTWGGLFTCLLGAVIASAGVFFAVRKIGERLVLVFFGKDKLERFAFLRDSKKIEVLTFILFFLPGVPKDLLTYLAGLTPIKPLRFLTISTLARIPALAASTLMGASASSGNWPLLLTLAAAAVVLAILGVFFRERLMALLRHHSDSPERKEKP